MAYDSDNVRSICTATTICIFLICIALVSVKGCNNYQIQTIETERIHFSGKYEQRMVPGSSYPIWVKIDTIEGEKLPEKKK